jgi:hypothetical protein
VYAATLATAQQNRGDATAAAAAASMPDLRITVDLSGQRGAQLLQQQQQQQPYAEQQQSQWGGGLRETVDLSSGQALGLLTSLAGGSGEGVLQGRGVLERRSWNRGSARWNAYGDSGVAEESFSDYDVISSTASAVAAATANATAMSALLEEELPPYLSN